ncbi:vancomycin high temperature exclusion protein [Actinocorallia sp. A-T 12471]|uniref:SanA/YdcF family protein n=1 Tax=Actinocorallia sp. A-T 12471 TaxID=3089813 RepID=UPI0029CD8BEA|nr:ElyC/SanA/YdcF family protein [Actinocorallia sp. A-T 12471]MDX6741883.1 ElyC/SanA/YdcF family protein [Actinocorallia sp. A-T 12471]
MDPRRIIGSRRARLIAVAVTLVLIVLAPTAWARAYSYGRISGTSGAPNADVALILGAGLTPQGAPTPFLARRLDIGIALLEQGKTKALLLSGDNGTTEYDEPTAMRDYLIAHGVPERVIVLDHAGFDTWDSCVRARKIFGVTRALVVSQYFHLTRAVALCRRAGIDAHGVGDSPPWPEPNAYGYAREIPAALKAMGDVILRRDPRFLGPREDGVDRALHG